MAMTGLAELAVTGALVLLVAVALLLVACEAEAFGADEVLLAMSDGLAVLAFGALFLATVEDGFSERRVGRATAIRRAFRCKWSRTGR